MSLRIIARLDVKPPNVVKPVHFEGLRKIGLPDELALKYCKEGADELLYIDIVASLYQREILPDLIQKTAKKLLVPFTAGGGVRSIDDFASLFHNGVDKVIINTYALQNDPAIITKAAEIFGSQAVMVHLVAKKWNDWWECYSDCGRIRSGKDAFAWATKVEELGAGEILVSSVDHDGCRRGFDIDLVKGIVSRVKIPVIAGSGAGTSEDVKKVILEADPDAVAISSILHYNTVTIRQLKEYLADEGIGVTL